MRALTGWRRDHPRSRGVHALTILPTVLLTGSSPLARGARPGPQAGTRPGGIIPARAGCTVRSLRQAGVSRDHPRSRGVHEPWRLPHLTRLGSSPLARGARDALDDAMRDGGIIPARAGCTTSMSRPRMRMKDHPRSRGVHARAYYSDDSVVRIIPARAGCTTTGAPHAPPPRDHPRSRGVHHPPVVAAHRGCRIIPARAGCTSSTSTAPTRPRDHPRSRGVHAS